MKNKKTNRCIYSNKIIEGRDCILVDYVKEYILKMFPELMERL